MHIKETLDYIISYLRPKKSHSVVLALSSASFIPSTAYFPAVTSGLSPNPKHRLAVSTYFWYNSINTPLPLTNGFMGGNGRHIDYDYVLEYCLNSESQL